MITSIILCLLTTWIIYAWGDQAMRLFYSAGTKESDFFIKYFLGLCILTFTANTTTLVVGLNKWPVLAIACIPILTSFNNLKGPGTIRSLIPKEKPLQLLGLIGLLLMTAMHAWEIAHPDTITYQNDLLNYSLESKHPSGIIAIKNRLAYGGAWFSVAALFSFKMLTGELMTFLNLSIVAVSFIYLLTKIDQAIQQHKYFTGGAILLIIAICFYEYTVFRLAITSIAPDTPAAIVGSVGFIYFLSDKRPVWILTLFCITAVTIKLSLAPILLLPIWLLIRNGLVKEFIVSTALAVMVCLPFFIKNVMSSGYLIYPFAAGKIINASFTPSESAVQAEADYIKAYARTTSASRDLRDIRRIVNMPLLEWAPVWFNELKWSGRIMLASFFIWFGWMLTSMRRNASSSNLTASTATSFLGFIFWLTLGPAIRFGTTFLLMPLMTYCFGLADEFKRKRQIEKWMNSQLLKIAIYIGIVALSAYLVYRFSLYMDWCSLLIPKGPID